ncbi:hypothetical protein [Thiomonas sp. FB-Cd]|uniref:hypothetical protein n=1 Tax=Thiomonas sp. FB-Cd TaxID=1158292 RepID=UPI0004DF039D|nr:hypothetical protein [Thiomonas sp. FB-Cd]
MDLIFDIGIRIKSCITTFGVIGITIYAGARRKKRHRQRLGKRAEELGFRAAFVPFWDKLGCSER